MEGKKGGRKEGWKEGGKENPSPAIPVRTQPGWHAWGAGDARGAQRDRSQGRVMPGGDFFCFQHPPAEPHRLVISRVG